MNILLLIIGVASVILNIVVIIQISNIKEYLHGISCATMDRDFKLLDLISKLIIKLNKIEKIVEEDDLDEIKEIIKSIPNKINDDYLRIAEETWRLHNRITRAELDKHIVQPEIIGSTPNHKRQELGLDPIESCDEPYVEGLELVEDEEVFSDESRTSRN